MSRGRRWLGPALLALPIAGTWIALILAGMSFSIAPIAHPGSSATYWNRLCGVWLPAFDRHNRSEYSSTALGAIDGVVYWEDHFHHGSALYSVPADRVVDDAAAVQRALTEEKNTHPLRVRCRAALPPPSATSASGLTALRAFALHPPDEIASEADHDALRARLERGHRIWLTLAFEGVYLTAWWLFLGWNLLPLPRLFSWRWQVGLAPFLLFVPHFLGYAPMTFTYGPSGGFVYPDYLSRLMLPLLVVPCTAADRTVWSALPQPLSWLSQLPGAPMAASYFACVGPVSSLLSGLAAVAAVSLAVVAVRRVRQHAPSPE